LALENEFVVKESKNNFCKKISACSDIAPKCTFDRIPMERIFANSTRFRNKLVFVAGQLCLDGVE
jgi:hypothetical protein